MVSLRRCPPPCGPPPDGSHDGGRWMGWAAFCGRPRALGPVAQIRPSERSTALFLSVRGTGAMTCDGWMDTRLACASRVIVPLPACPLVMGP
jgi:hypothetical protein